MMNMNDAKSFENVCFCLFRLLFSSNANPVAEQTSVPANNYPPVITTESTTNSTTNSLPQLPILPQPQTQHVQNQSIIPPIPSTNSLFHGGSLLNKDTVTLNPISNSDISKLIIPHSIHQSIFKELNSTIIPTPTTVSNSTNYLNSASMQSNINATSSNIRKRTAAIAEIEESPQSHKMARMSLDEFGVKLAQNKMSNKNDKKGKDVNSRKTQDDDAKAELRKRLNANFKLKWKIPAKGDMDVLLVGTVRDWMYCVDEDHRFYKDKRKGQIHIGNVAKAKKSEMIKVFQRIKSKRKLYSSKVWHAEEEEYSSGSHSESDSD